MVANDDDKPSAQAIEEAKNHPNGFIYRVDGDYRENEHIPPEAIVGAWKVNESGEIDGEFIPNPNYDPEKLKTY